jgi:hypothetical protein
MVAVSWYETLERTVQITRRHIPQESKINLLIFNHNSFDLWNNVIFDLNFSHNDRYFLNYVLHAEWLPVISSNKETDTSYVNNCKDYKYEVCWKMYRFLPLIIRVQKDGHHAVRTIPRQLTSSLILMCPVQTTTSHESSAKQHHPFYIANVTGQ